jgi:hypothetical protein
MNDCVSVDLTGRPSAFLVVWGPFRGQHTQLRGLN